MHIAILTFDGFNELDSLLALGLLNRAQQPGWQVSIASPASPVRSMNGLLMERQASLAEAAGADAVIIGSGVKTREIAADSALMAQLRLDPARQLVGAQCSGVLLLAKLGLLAGVPACTDLTSKPWVEQAGIQVVNRPFIARGNIATAGGCLASIYLACWVLARLAGSEAARDALHYIAPVGEKQDYVSHVLALIEPFLPTDACPATG